MEVEMKAECLKNKKSSISKLSHLIFSICMVGAFFLIKESGLRTAFAPFAAFAFLIGAVYFAIKYIAPYVDVVIKGRMRRMKFFWITFAIGLVLGGVQSAAISDAPMLDECLLFLVMLDAIWGICVVVPWVKRAHDIGWSSKIGIWMFLLMVGPLLGFIHDESGAMIFLLSLIPVPIMNLILLFFPGTNGANKYGDPIVSKKEK